MLKTRVEGNAIGVSDVKKPAAARQIVLAGGSLLKQRAVRTHERNRVSFLHNIWALSRELISKALLFVPSRALGVWQLPLEMDLVRTGSYDISLLWDDAL